MLYGICSVVSKVERQNRSRSVSSKVPCLMTKMLQVSWRKRSKSIRDIVRPGRENVRECCEGRNCSNAQTLILPRVLTLK